MHKVTAVVYDPKFAEHRDPAIQAKALQLYEFEVPMWYEAFDLLCDKIQERFPVTTQAYGPDDYEIRAISMMRVPD